MKESSCHLTVELCLQPREKIIMITGVRGRMGRGRGGGGGGLAGWFEVRQMSRP